MSDLLIKTESIIKIEATPQKDGSDLCKLGGKVHEDSEMPLQFSDRT